MSTLFRTRHLIAGAAIAAGGAALAGALIAGNRWRPESPEFTSSVASLPEDKTGPLSAKRTAGQRDWSALPEPHVPENPELDFSNPAQPTNLLPWWSHLSESVTDDAAAIPPAATTPDTSHLTQIPEFVRRTYHYGQRGVTFAKLFGPYLPGATYVEVCEPHLSGEGEWADLVEFLEQVAQSANPRGRVRVHVITQGEIKAQFNRSLASHTANYQSPINSWFSSLKRQFRYQGIDLTWELDPDLHDRRVSTDLGTQVRIDLGLHVWGWNNARSGGQLAQKNRICRGFGYQAYRGLAPARPTDHQPNLDDFAFAA